jgi:hypothetical protein
MLSGQLPPTTPTLELAGFKLRQTIRHCGHHGLTTAGPPRHSPIFRIRDLKQSIL